MSTDTPLFTVWSDDAKYLSGQQPDSLVDVAVSDTSSFSGDVRHARSITVPFRAFLSESVMKLQESSTEEGMQGTDECNGTDAEASFVFYLAQCPLHSSAADPQAVLPQLMRDVFIPSDLGMSAAGACSVNLW